MSTTSANLGFTLAVPADIVDVDAHISANFAILDSKWSTSGTPAAVQVGAAGTPGSSTVVSRSDHIHGITAGTAVATSTSNSAGSLTTVAASDHVHKVGDDSVVTASILALNVTETKIAAGAVTQPKIAPGAVGTVELIDNNITPVKLYTDAVPTAGQVPVYNVGGYFAWENPTDLVSTAIGTGAITTVMIADLNVTLAKLEAVLKPFVGKTSMYIGSSETPVAAAGWKFLNGQTISRTTFSALWVLMGSPNTGDGSTTFTLPNFKDRVPVGAGTTYTMLTGVGAASNSIDHTHTFGGGGSATNSAQGGNAYDEDESGNGRNTRDEGHTHLFGGTTSSASAPGTSVSVVQPSMPVHFIVYTGVAS